MKNGNVSPVPIADSVSPESTSQAPRGKDGTSRITLTGS